MSLSQSDEEHISLIITRVLNDLKARIETQISHEEHTQEAVERRMDNMTVPDLLNILSYL